MREPRPRQDAAGAPDGASPIIAFDAGPPGGVTLSPFQTIKCENPGPGKTSPERCDHVTALEDALSRAIREKATCAPASKSQYSVSFVMETDFRRKKLQLFAGKSSTIKREKAKELLRCVKSAMASTDLSVLPHQYVRYKVNVVATYPPSDTF